MIKMAEAPQYIAALDFLQNNNQDVKMFMSLYLQLNLVNKKFLGEQTLISLREVFSSQVKSGNARLFDLPNNDILLIFTKTIKDEIFPALVKVRFLLQEDEVVAKFADLQESKVAVIWDLEQNYENLVSLLDDIYKKSQNIVAKPIASAQAINFFETSKKISIEPFSTAMLDKLQKIIAVSDFSSFIRRQAICAVIGKSSPQRVFEEVYVSIPDMRDSLLPNVNLTSNAWLFLALTEELDRRVLGIIARHDDGSLRGNFSVNINVSTILSDDFLRFDESIDSSQRKSIVLELQLVDIFSDIRAFDLAKTFARSKGYKICIDGITVDKLEYVNRTKLDCDLMKIAWHPEFGKIMNEDKHFTDYANKSERAKIILCRVDDEKAIEVGNSLGINLYQGRYVQKLLSIAAEKRLL